MQLLDTVNLYGLHPQMQIANCKLSVLFYQFGVDNMVLTSAIDGKHSTHSLHKKGRACDYRIWYLDQKDYRRFVQRCKAVLGAEYDVVMEEDHLHVEYDPVNAKVI